MVAAAADARVLEQSAPARPSKHLQTPCWQCPLDEHGSPSSPTGQPPSVAQSAPFQPFLQWHTPCLHVPRPEQAIGAAPLLRRSGGPAGQSASWQRGPDQPAWHTHAPSLQYPSRPHGSDAAPRAVAHGCAPVTGAMPAPALAVAKVDGAREAGGGVVVIDPQSAPS